MMSTAAIAKGGGVAPGTIVALLQSAGAGGLATSTTACTAGIGAVVGAGAAYWYFKSPETKHKEN